MCKFALAAITLGMTAATITAPASAAANLGVAADSDACLLTAQATVTDVHGLTFAYHVALFIRTTTRRAKAWFGNPPAKRPTRTAPRSTEIRPMRLARNPHSAPAIC
jgi:hypothetical protein